MSSRSHSFLSSFQSSLGPVVQLLSPFSSPLLPGPLRRFYASLYRSLLHSSDLLLGIALGAAFSAVTGALGMYARGRWKRRMIARWEEEEHSKPIEVRTGEVVDGVPGLIGNTPLVRIASLSRLTGCNIVGKCEFLNPGGSVKDRVTLKILQDAERECLIHPRTEPRSKIFEGTSGSTGVSLAVVARAMGYEAEIVLPDDAAREKAELMEKMGASVVKVRPSSIVDRKHYVNLARQRALEYGRTTLDTHPHSALQPLDTVSVAGSFTGSRPPSPVASVSALSARLERSGSVGSVGSAGSRSSTRRSRIAPARHRHRRRRRKRDDEDDDEDLDDDGLPDSPDEDVVVRTQETADELYHRKPVLKSHEARGFFADQFENRANYTAHYEGTGPEIWRQTAGSVDAFVSGAGTGGTIAGVGWSLKERNPRCRIVLADPPGSGLYHKVKDGVMYAETEAEGRRRRHQVDTVVEGIGLNRATANFNRAIDIIDDAIRVTDAEAVAMSRFLVEQDGLFVGSSSAVNLVACVRVARQLGKGKTIVCILCDSGVRHLSKFWSDDYLRNAGIPISNSIDDILNGPLPS